LQLFTTCPYLLFAFNSGVLDQGLPKGGHYSTRTANATSEDSQPGVRKEGGRPLGKFRVR
jgi:hypothetical protein